MITTLHILSPASITYHTQIHHACGTVARRERDHSSSRRHCPPRCCAVRRARRSCASPLARPSSQRAARPSPATRRERNARRERDAAHPAAAARPPPAARRTAGHEREARRRCQSCETVAVLCPSVAIDGEKGIHVNKNFLPYSFCKTAREKNFLILGLINYEKVLCSLCK